MSSGRALGIGLLGAGVVLFALMMLWIGVSGAQSGGIVLGLVVALVLAGPLIGSGVYVLSRQQLERQEATAFATKRRVIDSDRVLRDEMSTALRAIADRPELRELRLGELADDLTAAYRRGGTWEDTIQLDDANIDTLRRYDDLVRERVRRLRDGVPDPAAVARELRQTIDQRDDLLRGRRAASMPPTVLLRSGQARAGAAELQRMSLGDAITYEGTDHLVEAVAEYFDEGERWRLLKLAPTGGETAPRWLYVGPGGLEVAVLDELVDTSPQQPGKQTAVVDVHSRAGNAEGVLVSYQRQREGASLRIREQWPDGTTRAYSGALVGPDELDVYI